MQSQASAQFRTAVDQDQCQHSAEIDVEPQFLVQQKCEQTHVPSVFRIGFPAGTIGDIAFALDGLETVGQQQEIENALEAAVIKAAVIRPVVNHEFPLAPEWSEGTIASA